MKQTRTPIFHRIPVIDVGPLFGADESSAHAIAAAIRDASTTTGFFYVRGHNVSADLIDAMHMAAKYFFALPDERKRAITINPASAHRGYVPTAQTKQPGTKRADLKESFNFAFPFTPDHPAMASGHPLIGINQWPSGEDAWRRVVERYYAAVFELGQRLLGAFALSLGLHRDFFRDMYRYPLVRTRMLYYPPQTESPDDGQFGAGAHTDYGTITLLWQDDVGGLQVRNRNGEWIDAPPIDNAFVINIGDMLEIWSNNLFVSTPHRVVNASGRRRYSIATFFDPDYDVKVECLPNCSSADNPPRHAPLVAGDYIMSRYDNTYAYRQPTKSWEEQPAGS
ncbi:MAG: isopenicillin N synthase family dioxygenase [Lautropia sp.]